MPTSSATKTPATKTPASKSPAPGAKTATKVPPAPSGASKSGAKTRPAAKAAAPVAAKPAVKPAPKPSARVAARPAAQGAPRASAAKRPAAKATDDTALPSLRFHHSHALRQKTWALLDEIEAASHPKGHNEAFADLVAELVQAGMDWYFLRPLQRAQVGFMAEQSAKLGLSGAAKMINSASRGFILRMDLPQLRVVAGYLREIG